MECHVLFTFVEVVPMIDTFDLWMSCERFDTFKLVVNCINDKCESCHIMINIFEVHETLETTMILQLKDFFVHFYLCDKVITYVKNEVANLNSFTNALTSIISCVPLCC
jgi:hypothetical protein